MGASVPDQALVASDQAASRLAPTGFDPSRMKPSIPFLKKVGAGGVKRVRGYTRRKGGYDRFVGGEKLWEKHYRAGFVTRPGIAQLGLPGVVELTSKGLDAIAMEAAKPDRPRSGLDPEGDSAGPKDIAQTTAPSTPGSNP
jgi:hypothetical protein